MRILYHHRTQAEDGQAVHVRAMIDAFERVGHEVLEVGLVRHAQGGPRAAPRGRSRWSWVTRAPRFVRELAEYGYSAVGKNDILRAAVHFEPTFLYERYAFGNAAGVLAARHLRLPLVLEVNAPMVLELERTRGLTLGGLARRMERFLFTSADLVCVVSGVLRDMLLDVGVPEERLLVTPNGVDLARYDHPDREAARRELGLPPAVPDELVLGFVGYYRDWHRLDVVLEALARPPLERARLVLVGEGPARADLERRAQETGVRPRLHLAGPRPHARIPALLPAFDVALVPAINEYASPLKLHEYMASALAIVAPDQPNLREVLAHERDALLVRPGDARSLAGAVARLAGDAALRARLGTAARRTLEERGLTWERNAERVTEAVERLLAERIETAERGGGAA